MIAKYTLEEYLKYGNHNLSDSALGEIHELMDTHVHAEEVDGELSECCVDVSDLFDNLDDILKFDAKLKSDLVQQIKDVKEEVETLKHILDNSIEYHLEKINSIREALKL